MKPSILTYIEFYKDKGGIQSGGTRYLERAMLVLPQCRVAAVHGSVG